MKPPAPVTHTSSFSSSPQLDDIVMLLPKLASTDASAATSLSLRFSLSLSVYLFSLLPVGRWCVVLCGDRDPGCQYMVFIL
jgi:hypothetical protein